jgi:hypothetical protein
MMSHGAPAAGRLHRESGANLSAESFDEERHLARAEPSARGGQTPGQARPVKAVSRQSRARASASLDGPRLVRQRSFRAPIAQQRQVGSASATHCTDLLCANENLAFCNVRRCQKNCDKLLHWLTIDRGAPCPFILLSSGRLSAPRRSCAIVRQTAIGQKPGQA